MNDKNSFFIVDLKITDMPEELYTLSEASAGGIEPDSISFDIAQKVVDDTILVSKEAIANAIKINTRKLLKVLLVQQ